MVALDEVLHGQQSRILDNWWNAVCRKLSRTRADRDDAVDTIPDYLDALGRAAKGEPGAAQECASVLHEHLERRMRTGSLEQVLLEHALLVETVSSVWAESVGLPEELSRAAQWLVGELGSSMALACWLFRAQVAREREDASDFLEALAKVDTHHAPADLDKRLNALAGLLARAIGATNVQILVQDAGATQLTCEGGFGLGSRPSFDVALKHSSLPTFEAELSRSVFPLWLHESGAPLAQVNPLARVEPRPLVLGSRLQVGERLVGTLLVGWTPPYAPDASGRPLRALLPLFAHQVDWILKDAARAREVEKLKEEAQMRERFVSMLAHDLRGPLAVGRLAAQKMLNLVDRPERMLPLVEKVLAGTEHANAMIRDLLDATYVQTGRTLPIRREWTDLSALCRDLADELSVDQPGRVQVVSAGPVEGLFDRQCIRRSVWNLITNALKHGSDERTITVTVSSHDASAIIQVHNTGVPLSADEQRVIFTPFRQLARAGRGGWGLGLPLVRACARAHGGEVTVSSSAADGTTFILRLPDVAIESTVRNTPATAQAQPRDAEPVPS